MLRLSGPFLELFPARAGAAYLATVSNPAQNDYDLCPGNPNCGTSCTGFGAPGRDVVYRIEVPSAGNVLHVIYQLSPIEADATLYLVTDCGNVAATCVAGEDTGSGTPPETLDYSFTAPGTYYLILDAFVPDAGGDWVLSGFMDCVTSGRAATWGSLKIRYR